MQRLIHGIHQFQAEDFGPLRGLFAELAERQRPETLFITCSDSRIDPNLLTRSRPGDLFILRNAGNIVPPNGATPSGEAATIEFAVAALGVRDVVVCGHTHCGAMKGLLHPEQLDALPAVRDWLGYAETTRRIVADHYGQVEDEGTRLLAATEENVLVQLEHLRTLPAVATRLRGGGLRLHGWVYHLESGAVEAYDLASEEFIPIDEYRTPPSEAGPRLDAGRDI